MNKFSTKRILAVVCALAMGTFVACNNGDSNVSQADLDSMQARFDSLMEEHNLLKQANPELDGVTARKDSIITAQAAEIQQLLNQLKQQNKQSNSGNAAVTNDSGLMRQIKEKENTIKQLQAKLDNQAKELKQVQKDLASGQNKDCSTLTAELRDQIRKQEKTISDLEAQVKSLSDIKAVMGNTNKDLNKQLESCNSNNAQMNRQLADVKAQIAQLQNSAKNEQNASDSYEAQIKQLNAQIAQLNASVSEKEFQIEAMTEQVKTLKAGQGNNDNALASQIASLQSQIKSLQGDVKRGEAQIEKLSKQVADAEAKEAASTKRALEAEKQVADLQAELKTAQKNLADTQSELSSSRNQLAECQKNSAKGNEAQALAELTAQVEQQKAQIAQLNKDLQAKEAGLADAKSQASNKNAINQKLNELQALCDGYKAEIERLRAENAQLKEENDDLKSRISGSARTEAENARLSQKVILASVLIANDLHAVPGKGMASANVVKPTTKAKTTAVVHITGVILRNNVIDPGTQTIYARITNANNRIVSNGAPASFVMADGTDMLYTLSQDIEYTGMQRPISMVWKKDASVELQPGLYWVTLFCNGYEIGKTSFKLS